VGIRKIAHKVDFAAAANGRQGEREAGMGITLIDYVVMAFAHGSAALIIVGHFCHRRRSTGSE
jgi:hypothetical protein